MGATVSIEQFTTNAAVARSSSSIGSKDTRRAIVRAYRLHKWVEVH
jgi:hypothetical protein